MIILSRYPRFTGAFGFGLGILVGASAAILWGEFGSGTKDLSAKRLEKIPATSQINDRARFEVAPAADDRTLEETLYQDARQFAGPDALESLVEVEDLLADLENQMNEHLGTVPDAQKIFETDPRDPAALARLDFYYSGADLGDTERLEFYKKAFAANPERQDLAETLLASFEFLGHTDTGLAFFESMSVKHPTSSMPLRAMALLYDVNNDYENAAAMRMRAAEVGEDPIDEIQVVHHLIDTRRFGEAVDRLVIAEREFEKAVTLAVSVGERMADQDVSGQDDAGWLRQTASTLEDELAVKYSSDSFRLATEFNLMRTRFRLHQAQGQFDQAGVLLGRIEQRLVTMRQDPDLLLEPFLVREERRLQNLKQQLAH